MMALRAFTSGLKTGLKVPGLVLTLYVINVAVALPLALTFRSIITTTFGNSMAIESFLDGFDFAVYQDFLTQADPAIGAFAVLLLWVLVAYVLVNTLLAGGTLTVVASEARKFSLASFAAGCGRYFGRFFRLFLIYVVLILLVAIILGAVLAGVFSAATADADSEVILIVWGIVVGSIGVTVLGLLLVALDFAKVATVRSDLRSMLRATGGALGFVFRRIFTVMLSVIFVLLALAAGTALYLWLVSAIGMDSDVALAGAFLLQQLYIFYRIYLRVAFYDCELSVHGWLAPVSPQENSPAQAPAPVAPA